MKTKHTPGPWESRPLYSTNDNLSGVFRVAMSAHGRSSKRLDAGGAFEHADARLIAAAPDLLVALQALLSDYTMTVLALNDSSANPLDFPLKNDATAAAAYAAIAKATETDHD